jgi:hypothetical protein
MIKGTYFGIGFEINNGYIKTEFTSLPIMFDNYREPFPSPGEGDPDMVIFERMKEDLQNFELISYTPPVLKEGVAY